VDRICQNCGRPLGTGDRCPTCGMPAPLAPTPHKKRKPILILLILVAVLAIGVALFFLIRSLIGSGGGSGDGPRTVVENDLKRPGAEEYLADLGSVASRQPVRSSDLLTEAEALRAFAARGFEGMPVTAPYDPEGNYLGEREISPDGKEKHPYYSAYFLNSDEELWALTLMGDGFYAEPVTYNSNRNYGGPFVLSETGEYVTYDGKENVFLTLTPKEEGLQLKRIGRIDAETLEELDRWEVAEL